MVVPVACGGSGITLGDAVGAIRLAVAVGGSGVALGDAIGAIRVAVVNGMIGVALGGNGVVVGASLPQPAARSTVSRSPTSTERRKAAEYVLCFIVDTFLTFTGLLCSYYVRALYSRI